VLLRIADQVAQHAQEAVAALGDQEGQPQRLGRQRGAGLRLRHVADVGRGAHHALRGGGPHAAAAMQHAVDRGQGDLGPFRDGFHARQWQLKTPQMPV
jgi:hypothetical protein